MAIDGTAVQFTADFHDRWTRLAEQWARCPGSTLGTLGPAGTSSEVAAAVLADRHTLKVELFDTFDAVLDRLVDGTVDWALVPSAYQWLTRFHWHPRVQLQAFFPMATPDYGIAAPEGSTGTPPGGALDAIQVASMSEVRRVYNEVVPGALREREVRWVDANSTQHAAQLLAAGKADLAVTNALGVHNHDLRWLARRPGAEIVWTLFGSTPVPAG
ncbi:MAG TPA: prephenate dehydratase [Actinocrinis sp.]|nr:prephenate dehydratase [Actinocrinis sp.]